MCLLLIHTTMREHSVSFGACSCRHTLPHSLINSSEGGQYTLWCSSQKPSFSIPTISILAKSWKRSAGACMSASSQLFNTCVLITLGRIPGYILYIITLDYILAHGMVAHTQPNCAVVCNQPDMRCTKSKCGL